MIRGYTDIEQSKKLAEILPLESADMWYDNNGESIAGRPEIRCCSFVGLASKNIPCWSLSALLNVLPRIDIEKEIWSSENYDYRVKAYIGDGYVGDWYDNPIDACYEMVTILKERNLL